MASPDLESAMMAYLSSGPATMSADFSAVVTPPALGALLDYLVRPVGAAAHEGCGALGQRALALRGGSLAAHSLAPHIRPLPPHSPHLQHSPLTDACEAVAEYEEGVAQLDARPDGEAATDCVPLSVGEGLAVTHALKVASTVPLALLPSEGDGSDEGDCVSETVAQPEGGDDAECVSEAVAQLEGAGEAECVSEAVAQPLPLPDGEAATDCVTLRLTAELAEAEAAAVGTKVALALPVALPGSGAAVPAGDAVRLSVALPVLLVLWLSEGDCRGEAEGGPLPEAAPARAEGVGESKGEGEGASETVALPLSEMFWA